jgi:hypothetical protein
MAAGEVLRMPGVTQGCDHLDENYNITPVVSVFRIIGVSIQLRIQLLTPVPGYLRIPTEGI